MSKNRLYREKNGKLYLNLSREPVADTIFKTIAQSSSLLHVEYHNKKYYEIQCNKDVDEVNECSFKCKYIPKNNNNVKYIVDVDFDHVDDSEEEDDDRANLIKKMKEYGKDNIVLRGFDNLYIVCVSGFNIDHRGSTHCAVNLIQHDSLTYSKRITIMDATIAYYKVKSHKWDEWYELFCDAKISRRGKDLTISLEFDHGS